jgi:hypothetical protein
MFHIGTFSLLLWVIGFCALASIIARILPKRTTITTTQVKDESGKVIVTPEEKASLQKFFEGFVQPRSWFKTLAFLIMATIIIGVSYCIIKEVSAVFIKKAQPVSTTISNTGAGKVESKTESKTETKQSNGLNLNIFTGWF